MVDAVGESKGRSMRKHASAGMVFGLFCAANTAVLGCGDGESSRFVTNPKAIEATVSVKEARTTVGFVRGRARVIEEVGDFAISTVPVTRKQYESCVKAGACGRTSPAECGDRALVAAARAGSDENAAVCVGEENAKNFCRWVGGRLPTLAEWLTAARGTDVVEFPWRDGHATCAQHPRSVEGEPHYRGVVEALEGCENDPKKVLRTGKHPDGAARGSKLQDVLLTPAELVVGSEKSPFTACSAGQSCLVHGMNPGGIDGVRSYRSGGGGSLVYGFRCVVEG